MATCHVYGNMFDEFFSIYLNTFEGNHKAWPVHRGGWCP